MHRRRAAPIRATPFELPRIITRSTAEETGHTPYFFDSTPLAERSIYGAHESASSSETVLVPEWVDAGWIETYRRARQLAAVHPAAVFCSLTAAELYGLPLPARHRGGALHVLTRATGNRTRMRNTIGHRSDRLLARSVHDLQLNHPAYVLLELAGLLDRWTLVRVCDAIVGGWNGPPMTTIDDLRAFVATQRRYTGKRTLVDAAASARADVDSPKETDVRLTIVRAGLPEPEVHPEIRLASGHHVFPDLGYRREQVVLEYEGRHHRKKGQWDYDIERYDDLRDIGYLVIRITSTTPESTWLGKLERALETRQVVTDP